MFGPAMISIALDGATVAQRSRMSNAPARISASGRDETNGSNVLARASS
jgi:hypothetical protein